MANGFIHGAVAASTGAVKRFASNKCTMLAASIAFYSAFSLSPTLLIVLAVAGWFFGADAAKGRLFDQVRDIMGNDAASAMQAMVEHAITPQVAGWRRRFRSFCCSLVRRRRFLL